MVQLEAGGTEYALQRRVDEGVERSSRATMEEAGKAGDHLRLAWDAIYGRSPNSSEAYSRAVKAVEVAAGPVVTPNDPTATLGKMIGALRDKPEKWQMAIAGQAEPPVEVVRHMMQLLWTGQHDRHGNHDPEPPLDVSDDEAAAAVHLAATLVQWFSTKAVAPVPGS